MDNVIRFYENYREEDRLSTNNARRIEFLTTVRAFAERFPPQGRLLDCAAGTGAYALHYAGLGYEVTATDLTPRHIEVLEREARRLSLPVRTAVMDATDLSAFADTSFDVVLCMGPYYHLTDGALRAKCLAECARVLRPGGLLAVAYISRYFLFPHVATSDHKYLNPALARTLLDNGALAHDDPNCFWTDSYFAAPDEMEAAITGLGLELIDHFAQDGLSPMLRTAVDRWEEAQFQVWCDYHYAVCREPSLLGASNHGLALGRKSN